MMTSDEDWDPAALDHDWGEDFDDTGEFQDCIEDPGLTELLDDRVTMTGDIIHPDVDDFDEDPVYSNSLDQARTVNYLAAEHQVKRKDLIMPNGDPILLGPHWKPLRKPLKILHNGLGICTGCPSEST